MRLRIVSGTLGGRFLPVPKQATGFRPTAQRTRESVTNRIRDRIPGARVADLCAGSGAFGFEMISCGAEWVDFVEKDRRRAGLISRLATELGVKDRCAVCREDVRRFVEQASQTYDIIYFDPPYDAEHLMYAAELFPAMLSPHGVAIFERRSGQGRPWKLVVPSEFRVYGDTTVEFFYAKDMRKNVTPPG